MSKPNLPDIESLFAAGMDPKTGLPIKYASTAKPMLKENIRKTLRIVDEQDAINRYKWYNLPRGMNSQLLERILYYKGQAALFYMDADEKFYFLPYALDGTIDVYGRYTGITPLPFHGSASGDEKKIKPWITGLHKTPVYEVVDTSTDDIIKNGCVLLSDYSKQIGQTNISRQILQDPILDAMAEAFPLARTSLIANSGIKGMRVQDEDQAASVKAASRGLTKAALEGDPWIPLVGSVEFQDLTNGVPLKSEEYLLYMQALDNYRLGLYGISNGGIFQKKTHMLQSEQDMNSQKAQSAYQDGLLLRQEFCNIVNSIWGLGIWCEANSDIVAPVEESALINKIQSTAPAAPDSQAAGNEEQGGK